MERSGDFTEDEYRELLRLAKREYRFATFDQHSDVGRLILWRHDVDMSPARALALARIEADEQVRATYFVLLRGPFYNALDEESAAAFREIADLGHELGLHLDLRAYRDRRNEIERLAAIEQSILVETFERPIRALSVHDPDLAGWTLERDEIAGMINASGPAIRSAFAYCSDSNGIWRFRPLRAVLEEARDERLHVVTHPEWWWPEPLTPRARVERCIDTRAARARARYDRVLAEIGRPNVGVEEPS